MSKIDNGGPAFPRDHAADGHNGMTLRDYFAAKAMQAVAGSLEWTFNGKPMDPLDATDAALVSYQLADAMLKARQS